MNGIFLTSDESKLAAYTSNAICTEHFYRTNAEDKPQHDKAFFIP